MSGNVPVAALLIASALLACGPAFAQADGDAAAERTSEKDRRYYAAWGLPAADADTLRRFGDKLTSYQRFGEAREAYEEALRIDPDLDAAIWGLGLLHQRIREHDAAEEYFRALTGTGSEFEGRAYTNLGRLASARTRYDEALEYYRKAAEAEPDRADAHFNLGMALRQRGENDAALAEFDRVIALRDSPVMAHFQRALIHGQRGDDELAIAELEAMLAIDPGHPRALFNLGLIQQKRGRVVQAKEYFRRAYVEAERRGNRRLLREIRREVGVP